MTVTISATISDDQAKFVEDEGLSKSALLQKAIEKERREKEEGYGQINVREEYNTLNVSLRNYPTPVDSKKKNDRKYPTPLYKNEDGEIVDFPPIEKEKVKEDVKLVKREDNEEVCGVEIKNWEEHNHLSLVYLEKSEEPYVVLDPPEL